MKLLTYLLTPIIYFFKVLRWCFLTKEQVQKDNPSEYKEYNESVTVDIYQPRLARRGKRLTLIHPILGGDNKVAKVMANYLAILHRRPCAIVHRGSYPFDAPNPRVFERKLKAYLYNYYLVEQILTNEGYLTDDTQVISMGTSMGAIVNSMLATYDRYDRYICIVGGVPIISVMQDSALDRFDYWFQRQMSVHDMSVEDLHDWYYESVELDPSYKQEFFKGDKLRLISAYFDKVVSYKYQVKLDKLSNAKTNVVLPAGHYTIALFFFIILPLISWWTLTSTSTKRDNYSYTTD